MRLPMIHTLNYDDIKYLFTVSLYKFIKFLKNFINLYYI